MCHSGSGDGGVDDGDGGVDDDDGGVRVRVRVSVRVLAMLVGLKKVVDRANVCGLQVHDVRVRFMVIR